MNQSRIPWHKWTSHVAQRSESCHTTRWVMQHTNEPVTLRKGESCHTHERSKGVSRVTDILEQYVSRRVHVCEMTHSFAETRLICVWNDSLLCSVGVWDTTHMCESRHTCEWVMSHMWMSHVTHVNESCHTCEGVMSHIWMSHGAQMDGSWRAKEWVMSHIYTPSSHVTHSPSRFWGNLTVGIRVSHARRSVYVPYLINKSMRHMFLARKGVFRGIITRKGGYGSVFASFAHSDCHWVERNVGCVYHWKVLSSQQPNWGVYRVRVGASPKGLPASHFRDTWQI